MSREMLLLGKCCPVVAGKRKLQLGGEAAGCGGNTSLRNWSCLGKLPSESEGWLCLDTGSGK